MRAMKIGLACLAVLVAMEGQSQADAIYVIDAGYSHSRINDAKNHLTNLGHTLTNGGTLSDYSTYDQVWDLRYNSALGASDISAMGAYLAAGGRMYLTGEHSGFDGRNNSLVSFLSAVGAGALSLSGGTSTSELITPDGAVVNSPNLFSSVSYGATRTVAEATDGFLVTSVDGSNTSTGSLVGWDFNDISGASNARMLVGFDIEIFLSGQNWTENMATYLAGPQVPEPGSLIAMLSLASFGAGAVVFRRRRSKKLAA